MPSGDGEHAGLIREVTELGAEPVMESFLANDSKFDPEHSVHPHFLFPCMICELTQSNLLVAHIPMVAGH